MTVWCHRRLVNDADYFWAYLASQGLLLKHAPTSREVRARLVADHRARGLLA